MSSTYLRCSVPRGLSVLRAIALLALLPGFVGAQGQPSPSAGDLVVVDFARAPLGPFTPATAAAVVSGGVSMAPVAGGRAGGPAGGPTGGPTAGPGLRHVDGALEVVDHLGQRMLKATSRSTLLLSLPARTVLPADFTVAVDLVPKECCQPEDLALEGTARITQSDVSANLLWRHEDIRAVGGGPTFDQPMPPALAAAVKGQFTSVVFTFQGDLVAVYTNGQQVYALPNRQFVRGGVLRLFLGGQNTTDQAVYLAGVRVAAGVQPALTVATATAQAAGTAPGTLGAPTPITTMAPGTGTANPLPPSSAPNPPTGLMRNTGPVPTFVANLTVTQGPNGPVVNWQPPAAPAVYTIQRWKIDDQTCCNNTSPASPLITAPPWQDSPPPMAGTYVYQVTATTNGGSASAQTQFQYQVSGGGAIVTVPGATSSGPRTVTPMTTSTTTTVPTSTGATGGVLPTTFQAVVTAGPAGPVVTWTSVARATGYAVTRSKIDDASCCNTSSGSLGSASSPWQDQPLPVSGTYLYTVSAATPVGVLSTQVTFGFRVPGGAPAPGATQPATIVPVAPQTGTATPLPAPLTPLPPAPVTGTATPISSRFRLVALGFKAIAPSKDGADILDGHGDEVYLAAIPNQTKLTGLPLPVTTAPSQMLVPVTTRSHGDEAVRVPFGRIKAGSASPNGGIQAGDIVPATLDLTAPTGALQQTTFPFLLWEGDLAAPDDAVVVHLALWEDDVNPVVQAQWTTMIAQLAQSGYSAAPAWKGGPSRTGNLVYAYTRPPYDRWLWHGHAFWGDEFNNCPFPTSQVLLGQPGICAIAGIDRPFGAGRLDLMPAEWAERFLVLTRSLAEEALTAVITNGSYNTPIPASSPGTFRLEFRDYNVVPPHPIAHYELYLRVERVP